MSKEHNDGWMRKPKHWESSDNLVLLPEIVFQQQIEKYKKVEGNCEVTSRHATS